MAKNSIVLHEKWHAWILKRKKTYIANAVIEILWLWFTLSLYRENPNGPNTNVVIGGMLLVLLGLFLLAWGKPLYKMFFPAIYEIVVDNDYLIVYKNGNEKFRTSRSEFAGSEFVRQTNQIRGVKMERYSDNEKLHKRKYSLDLNFITEDEIKLIGPLLNKLYSLSKNNEYVSTYNAKTCAVDFDKKQIVADEYVIPFEVFIGYNYTHSYEWSKDHPQDPESPRSGEAVYEELMCVDGKCKELPEWYQDEWSGDISRETDDGYTYEEWGHNWSLDLQYIHEGNKVIIHFTSREAIKARQLLKSLVKGLMSNGRGI